MSKTTMGKKVLSLLMALVMCLSLIPTTAFAAGENTNVAKNTTSNTEYSDLHAALVDCQSGETVELLSDVTLTGNWTPVANFQGTFDGKNHTITGLTVTGTGSLGLFASIGAQANEEDAIVKNLIIDGAVINGTEDKQMVGVVTAYVYGNISGVTVKNATVTSSGKYVGGIVGMLDGALNNCSVTGSTITGKDQVGGAIGYVRCGGIKNSTVTGNTITATEERAGGLIGKMVADPDNCDQFFIVNNVVSGTANCKDDKAGGLAAEIGGYDSDLDAQKGQFTATYEIRNNDINVVLNGTYTSPIGVLRSDSCVHFNELMESNITGNWWTDATYAGGSFTYAAAETRTTAQTIYRAVAQIGETKYTDLHEALVACTAGQTVELLSDVDLTGVTWTPVANFQGTFDGKNHTITGLTVSGESKVGMFATLDRGIDEDLVFGVKNLTITGAKITATGNYAGVIAGDTKGPVIDSVKVTNSAVEAKGEYVGAIVGNALTDIINCTVTDCTIKGSDQVGGIVGQFSCGSITGCTVSGTTGKVTTVEAAEKRAGGLIGKMNVDDDNVGTSIVTVSGNTVTATVKAPDVVGGIAGQIMGDCAQYLIKDNTVNVTFDCTGTKNNIANLRDGQSDTFKNALPASVTGNTFDGVEQVYSAAGVCTAKVTAVAQIGETKYETLDAALAAVKSGETIVLAEGTFDPASVGQIANLNGKTFTIKGAGADKTTFIIGKASGEGEGAGDYRFEGANVTFEDMKIQTKNLSINYCGFVRTTGLNFKNCTFIGRISGWGNGATIDNCVFDSTDRYDYVLYTWGSDLTIKNTTFNTQGKAIKLYGSSSTLIVENCTFNSNGQHAGADKPAIAIANNDVDGNYTVTITNCTQTGFVKGVIGTELWGTDTMDDINVEKTLIVNGTQVYPEAKNFFADAQGVWHIANAQGWVEFAAAVNGGNTFEGKTVVLDGNIDMSSIASVAPVGNHTDSKMFKGTFDGQNYTISNIKVHNELGKTGVGLFGKVYDPAVIKNLNVVNATIEGDRNTAGDRSIAYVGGIAGHGYATITNCSFKGTIYGGYQVGGIAGSGGFTITGCTFDGSIVSTRDWALGGIIGNCQDGGAISNNTAKGSITAQNSDYCGFIGGGIVGCAIYTTYEIKGNNSQMTMTYDGNSVTDYPIVGVYNIAAMGTGNEDFSTLLTTLANNTWDTSIYSSNEYAILYNNGDPTESGYYIVKDGATVAEAPQNFVLEADGFYHIKNLAGLKEFAAKTADLANKTVVLDADINLGNEAWTPINGSYITFDGQGHTVKNFTVTGEKNVGFFGAFSCSTIKNLTIDGATVKGINHVAALCGDGLCTKIENCTVKNAAVTTVVKNNDDGDKAGAICGYLSGESVAWVKDCTVIGCTIRGYRDIGGAVGYVNGSAQVSNVTVKDTTVINDQDNNYKNYTADSQFDIHDVIGEYVAAATIGTNTISNVTVKIVNKKVVVADNKDAVAVSEQKQTSEVKVDSSASAEVKNFAEDANHNIKTTVTGVKLSDTNTAAEATKTGLQAVVDAAKEAVKTDAAKTAALESANEVKVEVKVEVKPVEYTTPSGQNNDGVVKFDLNPVAKVSVGSEVIAEDIEVTNEMIDQTQPITVTLYTGFEPAQIIHRADNGDVIETFNKGDFTYDAAAKTVTLTISHFSGLEVKQNDSVAELKQGSTTLYYDTLAEAVADVNGNTAATITLLKDCSGNGISVPSGKNITVDFGGYTYTVNGNTVGSAGTETQAFQLLQDSTITFKNGTITSDKAKILIQNYANLTLDGMTLDGRNLADASKTAYTLSTNNGATTIKDTTIWAREADGVAFDVCCWSPYTANRVTLTSGTINGDIEVSSYNDLAPVLNLNGGTVNGDLVMGDDAGKCVVTKSNVSLSAPEGYVWNNAGKLAPAVAKIGTTEYATLEDALDAATNGQTVQLLANITGEKFVVVETGVTLDLNGHNITNAKLIYVTGQIVDSATSKGIVSGDHYYFDANETWLLIYNGTGYQFFNVTAASLKSTKVADKYGFYFNKTTDEEKAAIALIKNNVAGSRVKGVITFKWTSTTGQENIQDVVFSETLMSTYLNSTANFSCLAFTITGKPVASGSITAEFKFVTTDASGNTIASISAGTQTI